MLRRRLAVTATTALLLLASACGDDATTSGGEPSAPSSSEPSSQPSSDQSSEPAARTIDIDISDGVASTAGQRVEVGVGEPVDLVITSDVDGEMHVHSTPEQFLPFSEGTNDPIGLVIDRPGVVEIELARAHRGSGRRAAGAVSPR